jgi:hypothetical protein
LVQETEREGFCLIFDGTADNAPPTDFPPGARFFYCLLQFGLVAAFGLVGKG